MIVEVLLALAAMLLAGIIQGSSGFGFGLVAVGLMGIVLSSARDGAIAPVFANLALNLYMLVRYGRHVAWRTMLPFVCASMAAVPLGVWFLARVSEGWINLGLAAILIFSGCYALLPSHQRAAWHRLWIGIPLGLISGALAGAFGTGGPPAVAFVSNQKLDKLAYVSTLQLTFFLSGSVRVVSLGNQGLLTRDLMIIGGFCIIAAIAGCIAGNRIMHKLSDRVMRAYVCGFQILLGILYLVRAASHLRAG